MCVYPQCIQVSHALSADGQVVGQMRSSANLIQHSVIRVMINPFTEGWQQTPITVNRHRGTCRTVTTATGCAGVGQHHWLSEIVRWRFGAVVKLWLFCPPGDRMVQWFLTHLDLVDADLWTRVDLSVSNGPKTKASRTFEKQNLPLKKHLVNCACGLFSSRFALICICCCTKKNQIMKINKEYLYLNIILYSIMAPLSYRIPVVVGSTEPMCNMNSQHY